MHDILIITNCTNMSFKKIFLVHFKAVRNSVLNQFNVSELWTEPLPDNKDYLYIQCGKLSRAHSHG